MKKKEVLLALLFFSIITAVFFYKTIIFGQIPFPGDLLTTVAPFKTESYLGYGASGYPSKGQDPDVLYEIYPWRYFSIAEMKKGNIPFWNPHNFSGNLQMQNYQTAIFYPLTLFYFVLPFNVAWSLIIFSQPLLAAFFMYLFLRSLELKKAPSAIGAVAFAFSSYMTVWMEYGNIGSTMLWLPLVLFLIKRFVRKHSVSVFLLLIISLTSSFLAGYIQGVFYIYIIAFCYSVFLLFQQKQLRNFKQTVPIIAVFLIPILLACLQLIPTFEFFARSTRSPYTISQLSVILQPLYYWITIFVPDFFGNPATRNFWLSATYIERVMYFSIPLLFFALYSFRIKNKEKNFFLCVGIITLLLTANLPCVAYVYLIPIPVLSTTVATRALSIFIFCGIVAGAFGMQYWMENKQKEKHTAPVIFLGIYGIIWAVLMFGAKMLPGLAANFVVSKHNLLLPTLLAGSTIVAFYLPRKLRNVSLLLLFIIVLFDLFYSFMKITPFSPRQLLYPQTPVVTYLQTHAGINRFWGYGSAYIPSNLQSVDGTYSPEGNDPLHLKDYGILLASTKDGKMPLQLPRPDANIAPGYGTDDLRDNPYRQKVLDVLGVKYVLNLNEALTDVWSADEGTFPKETYTLVWQQKPWQVYENKKTLPRFFLTTKYVVAHDTHDALAKLHSGIDISKTLILDKQPNVLLKDAATGNVSLAKYEGSDVIFHTKTNGTMLLFLSDNEYPSWKARIDAKETPIYKADVTFRAVSIPKGAHTVEFYYDHGYFTLGVYMSLFGVVVCLLYLLYLVSNR